MDVHKERHEKSMPKFPQSGQFHGESNKRGAFLGAWAIAGFFNHLNLARNNFGATPAQFQVSVPGVA